MRRMGFFGLFLMCGLSIFAFRVFMPRDFLTAYILGISVAFLLSAMFLRGKNHLRKYFDVAFAFFLAGFVSALQQVVVAFNWWSGSTVSDVVASTVFNTILVIIPIIALTRIAGGSMASIYVAKGRFRMGLVLGLAAFMFFLVTSVQGATSLFAGRDVSFERVLLWMHWILLFVLSNGVREEVWIRGLLLPRFESFVGHRAANALQAVVFSLAHVDVRYTPEIFVFLGITFFLGVAFGVLTQKTRSLLGAILFHAGADVPVIIGIFSNL